MTKIAVKYVIQNDIWDNINEPNLYILPGTHIDLNKITAKIIYDTFPVKHQRFVFRFFLIDKINDLKLWMDLPPSATIPVYTDKIYVKALRLPENAGKIKHKSDEYFVKKSVDKTNNKNNLKCKSNNNNLNNLEFLDIKQSDNIKDNQKNIMNTNNSKVKNDPNIINENILEDIQNNLKDNKTNSSNYNNVQNEKKIYKQNKDDEFLNYTPQKKDLKSSKIEDFGGFEFDNTAKSKINKQESHHSFNYGTFNGDIFDNQKYEDNNFGTDNKHNSNNNTNNTIKGLDNDLFNITNNYENNNISETNIENNKNEVDLVNENQPECQMKEDIDNILNKWKNNYNGQPKELLILMSSLHEVWSLDNKLIDISLRELTEDLTKASRIYKKCMLLFHDDKLKKYSPKYKYLAKQLYYILNEANDHYRNKH